MPTVLLALLLLPLAAPAADLELTVPVGAKAQRQLAWCVRSLEAVPESDLAPDHRLQPMTPLVRVADDRLPEGADPS